MARTKLGERLSFLARQAAGMPTTAPAGGAARRPRRRHRGRGRRGRRRALQACLRVAAATRRGSAQSRRSATRCAETRACPRTQRVRSDCARSDRRGAARARRRG